jgi:two-component system response regulator YesN
LKRFFHNHNYRLFSHFMLSYLFVLFIPVIIGGVAYNEALQLVQQSVKDLNLAVLKQSRDVLDKQLTEVETITQQLLINPRINQFIGTRQPLKPDDYYQMKLVLDEIGLYKVTRNFIYDFLIYFKNSNYILTSETAYNTSLFNEVFRGKQSILEELRGNSYRRGEYLSATSFGDDRKYSVIPYIRSLPFSYSVGHERMEGNIMVLIQENAFRRLLAKADIADGGWVYVVDRNGKIITCISSTDKNVIPLNISQNEGSIQRKIENEPVIVTYTTSNYNGWKYVAVLPSQIAMVKADFIKKNIIFFILGSLLIGTVLAYYLTYRNTLPLQKIIKTLNDSIEFRTNQSGNTYQFLQGSIVELINNNNNMQAAIKEQRPLIRAAFFDQVLNKGCNSREEMCAIMNYLGINPAIKQFQVMIIRMISYDEMLNKEIINELDMTKAVIKEVIQKYIGDDGCFHDIGANRLAVLLISNSNDQAEILRDTERLVNQIFDELLSVYNIQVFFAIGGIYTDAMDIPRSYEEANLALDYQWISDPGKLIWYCQIPKETEMYYYPIELEQRVINLAKAGKIKQLDDILIQICQENIKRTLSLEMTQQLIYGINGTILRVLSQIKIVPSDETEIKEKIENMDLLKPIEEYFKGVESIFNVICKQMNEQKKSHNVQLQEKILEYINHAWFQPGLCLQEVASHFSLTDGYLSHFFKDQTGENFTVYLENIRVAKACEMIKDGKYTMSEIAEKVGYNSSQAFRRAFKRVKGISPSEFSG